MEDGSGPSPAKAGEVQSFDWRQYLTETESTTPPLTVFYHNTEQVPENKFQLGQLILVPDKKGESFPGVETVRFSLREGSG